jgi:hypothetical protein
VGESEAGIMTTKPRAGVGYLIVYSDMQDSPAFNAMRPLAQLLVMKVKRFYDRKTQGPVRVSERTAAKLTGTSRDTARSLCREAVHYGCWREYSAGHLSSNGKGVAAAYQLTDEIFMDKPATLDFLHWDGTPFGEQHTPAYYKRKERSLTRLKAFKARGKNNHKKQNPGLDTQSTLASTHSQVLASTHSQVRQKSNKTLASTHSPYLERSSPSLRLLSRWVCAKVSLSPLQCLSPHGLNPPRRR